MACSLQMIFVSGCARGEAATSGTATDSAANQSFHVVGYYSMTEALGGAAPAFPFDKVSHVNLYFLNPDANGNFPDVSGLTAFIQSAHAKGVSVMASIGGGSAHPQYHTLLKDDKRPAIVKSLLQIVAGTGLDGIDVDLEGDDIDADSYEALVTELADGLHAAKHSITSAVAVYFSDKLTDKALAQYDFINLMSYDHTGEWNPAKPGPHATYEDAVTDLQFFLQQRHIPKSKITLGVPFYGYSFGPTLTSKAGSMNYGEIVTLYPGAEKKDEWPLPGGATIYYNGMPTISKKIALAKDKAAGIMIWQLDGDATGALSLLTLIGTQKKITGTFIYPKSIHEKDSFAFHRHFVCLSAILIFPASRCVRCRQCPGWQHEHRQFADPVCRRLETDINDRLLGRFEKQLAE